MTDPIATIVICNYNYARYLGRTICLALAQTVPVRIIVVDDASTDESVTVARSFPVDVIEHETNSGNMALGWTEGIERCDTPFIHFLSSDDLLVPHAIETLADHGIEADWCYCDLVLIDEHDREIGRWTYEDWPLDADAGLERGRRTLTMPVPFIGLHRMAFIRRYGLRGVRWPITTFAEDTATSLEWLRHGPRITRVPQELYRYRRHAGAISFGPGVGTKRALVRRDMSDWFRELDAEPSPGSRG